MVRSRVVSVPSPVGGWNTRDPLANMPKEDAVILINFDPKEGYVSLRAGNDPHATGMTGSVDSLAEYNYNDSRHLIAFANLNIWNATNAGAATSLASGFSSNRWQWVNFNAYLIMVNGADTPQTYNGSVIAASTISGPTVTSLKGVHVHKNRVYTWETNSSSFWYGATNAIGGAFSEFPLTRISKKGGALIAMGTLTHDSGSGPDDFAVFLLSSGEAVIYQGSDPGTAASWSLVGIYDIGAPLSERGLCKIGGDLMVITREDYVSLSKVLGKRETIKKTKAVGAIQAAAKSYSSNFGWQAVLYPAGSKAIFNVPNSSNEYVQHVMNTTTGAWCKYTGMNARCWVVFNNELYFGGASGVVYKADTGYSDNSAAINGDALTAWNNFSVANNKQVTAFRNLLTVTASSITVSTEIGSDFNTPNTTYTSFAASGATVTPWDTSPWGSAWSSENYVYDEWQSDNTEGRYIAQRLKVSSGVAGADWVSTDYVVQEGGLI